MVKEVFEVFKEKWNENYLLVVRLWEYNWENFIVFLVYFMEIRQFIYIINIIESFNVSLRKYIKNKCVFFIDNVVLKLVYLVVQ